jgi:hypothetical protein
MTTLAKIKAPFAHWREWEPNPVLLKELRQAMRNPVLTSTLMLLLTALFLVPIVYFTRENFAISENAPRIGLQIFRAFLLILTVISLLFVPLYTGIRLAVERQDASFELMFATALPVWKIVRGKFLSAAYIQVMFFSIFLPFMSLASLLHGVDLPTIFFILACLFVVVCMAVQAAIALAYLPVGVIGRIGIGILFMGGLLLLSRGLFWSFSYLLQAGIGTLMGSAGFWFVLVVCGVFAIPSQLVLYAIAVLLAAKERYLRDYCKRILRNGLPTQT